MATKTWKIEKDLCRCCHAEGTFDNLAEPRTFLEKEEVYSDMLRECLDLDIPPVPGELCAITYSICNACITRLRDACNFKKQVQDCEQRFMTLYYKNAIQGLNTETVVKEELEVSIDDNHSDDDIETIVLKKEEDDDDDSFMDRDDDDDDMSEDFAITKKPTTSMKTRSKPKAKPKAPPVKKEKPQPQPKKKAEPKPVKEKKGKERKIDRSFDEFFTITEDGDGTELFACKLCTNVFKKRDLFKQHYRHVHLKMRPKLIGCYYCKEKVAAHMRAHHLEVVHGVPAPSCGACGKKFAYPFQVLKHQKTYHMGERKYDCNICDKTFASRGNLAQHVIKHSNDRPFRCDLCEETFKWKKHLRRHMQIHSQKRN
ncbi:zinc finger and SCAN domain-containing protein 26-like isoform X18 [Pararge aegeria]|uniref:zinc finger and SCAN domain-containing protein 26-like isoform X18 n=1 Tax=Pararge aegeria TaxID=116150 RepID=UPI0019D10DC3|nr:zinc finger and SCAN domain-containing protein 26-like isoform X18 [Pararge aegeria]